MLNNNKKKILYIHHGKGLGGAPLSLLYLIENLDKKKYYPIVLFLHYSEVVDLYKSKGIEIAGVVNKMDFSHTKIYWFRWYHFHHLIKSFVHNFQIYFCIAGIWLNKIRPDLVHLNTSSLFVWAMIAKKLNIPVVFHIREPLSNGYFGIRKRIITYLVERYSDIIMPICKNDAKPWQNNSKVKIVYNAVDKRKFNKDLDSKKFIDKYNLKINDHKILFLGGLSKEKGTLEILQIFKRLLIRLPNAKLIIAGYFNLNFKNILNPKYFFPTNIYKRKVKDCLRVIKKSVIFTGPIKNVEDMMSFCDVVVVPSTKGHFARPIIEAGFMAKPVVGSKISPLNELVIDKKTGFLIDIDNKNLWIKKLYDLLCNKCLNNNIGQNAYKFCIKRFDVIDQVKKVENYYWSLLNK